MERKFDFSKIAHRCTRDVSMKEALSDVVPIPWSDDVINGRKKVVIYEGGVKNVQGKRHNPD